MRIVTLTAAALALTAGVASASQFSLVDQNDDGTISKAEFVRIYGPDLDTSSFWAVDKDRNGTIDAGEFSAALYGFNGILNSDS